MTVEVPGGRVLKTVIILGYQCNNRCRFCIAARKRVLSVTPSRFVAARIARAAAEGSRYLEFIGGEATLREDLPALVAYARRQGFTTVCMATNGRMFAYPRFARSLVDAGLTDVIMSIHGHEAGLHDGLTRAPGSFRQLLAGLANLRARGLERIGSNTTIVKPNVAHLSEIGRRILGLGLSNSEFIFVDCNQGGAYERFDELVPRISEAAGPMRRLLELGRGRSTHWCVRYVPLCHFLGYEDQISEVLERRLFSTRHFAPDFVNRNVEDSRRVAGRVRPARCRGCALYDECEGLFREYYRRRGDAELRPVRARSSPAPNRAR